MQRAASPQLAELAVSGPQLHHLAIACHAAAAKTALSNASAKFAKFNHVRLLFFGTVWLGGPVLWLASFHFQIARVLVASPCRAAALSAASRLDTSDWEMESDTNDNAPSGRATCSFA